MNSEDARGPALDPDAAARVASFGVIPPMRERGFQAVRAALEAAPRPEMATMADIEEVRIPGPVGDIPLRIYRPSHQRPAPVLVYYHGGGMVLGTNHSFEPLARALAQATGATVVSVEYHLAPEFPAPAQFNDAYAAACWTSDHGTDIGIDPERLVVIGDSAGGTLAAAVALAARDRGGPRISCQVLLYPGVDRDMTAESILAMPNAPMLTLDDILYMHELADGPGGPVSGPYRTPAYAADLSGLPPAIVVTGECDPIRDWGERYAQRLRDARVQTTLTRYPGCYHGFLMRWDTTARGRLALAEVAALLRAKLDNPLPF